MSVNLEFFGGYIRNSKGFLRTHINKYMNKKSKNTIKEKKIWIR